LNFQFELVPSGCAAESCGHWISLKQGLDLSFWRQVGKQWQEALTKALRRGRCIGR